jgi:hypothetical protein
LERNDRRVEAWLNGSLGVDALREWPVSRRVNRAGVGEDDPTIIEKEGGGGLMRSTSSDQ